MKCAGLGGCRRSFAHRFLRCFATARAAPNAAAPIRNSIPASATSSDELRTRAVCISKLGQHGQTCAQAFAAPALGGPPPPALAHDCPPAPRGTRLRAASASVGPSEPSPKAEAFLRQFLSR